MSKVLNRAIFMFVFLLSFVLLFSGCSLWTVNEFKVLNQKAATVNDIVVTYEDVYNAYNSYGNYYFDSQGTPTLDGMKSTATQLINRKLLVQALKDKDGEYYTSLTTAQTNEVWNSVYESLNSTLESYQKSLMENDDKKLPTFSEDEDEDSQEDYEKEYETYEKTYVYELNENGQYELVKVQEEKEIATNSDDVFKFTAEEMEGYSSLEEKLASMSIEDKAERAYNNFRQYYWTHFEDTYKNSKNELYSELAFRKMISVLRSNEKDPSLSTETKQVFYHYLDKLFEETLDSKLITVFQENFEESDVISEELVIQTFKDLVNSQNEKYRDSYNNYSAFVNAMKNRSEPMLYFEKTSEWFQVSHILLKFSDEDVTSLKTLQKELQNGKIILETYTQKVQEIKNGMKFTDRKDGKSYTATEVLTMIQDAMGITVDGTGKATYSPTKTAEERIQIFNDFIYRFNMDAGANNAELAYYIPLDQENDSMVTPFANESRTLYNNKTVGSISGLVEVNEIDGYEDNDGKTQTPSYSGFHIIIYLGEIAQIDTTNFSLADLNSYVLNPLNNNDTNRKSMLDYVIEKISIDNYTSYQSSVLANLKGNSEITYYTNILQDLVNKFTK